MDLDQELLLRVIEGRGASLKRVMQSGIRPSMLTSKEKEALKYILGVYKQYGNVPSLNVVEEEVDLDLGTKESTGESLDFIIDNIIRREKTIRAEKILSKSVELLRKKEPDKALSNLKDSISRIQESFKSTKTTVVDLTRTSSSRWKKYSKLKSGEDLIGIPSPWPTLNDCIGGFKQEEVTLFEANISVGKTLTMCVLLAHFWEQGLRPMLVSMETSLREIAVRFDSICSKVPAKKLGRGVLEKKEEKKYKEFLRKFKSKSRESVYILGNDSVSTVTELEILVSKLEPSVVIVDAIYFLRSRAGNDGWENQASVSTEMKRMAKRYKVPVIITNQFHRRAYMVDGKEGGLEHTAGTIRFAQDATVVIGIYGDDTSAMRRLKVLKNSQGELADFEIAWELDTMDFSEIGGVEDKDIDIDF